MANQGWFDRDAGRNKALFDPIMQKTGLFDKMLEEYETPIPVVDRPHGSIRPFPFLPSGAPRRG